MNRLDVLMEISRLTDTHCKRCEVVKNINLTKGTIKFCIEECLIGKKFRKLGNMLESRKNPRFSLRDLPINERYTHITKEILERELAKEKTYTQIEKDLGLAHKTLKNHLKRHGISLRGQEGRKIKARPPNVFEKYPHLTKEVILSHLSTGKTYYVIEEEIGIPFNSMRYLLKFHGIPQRPRGRKRVQT